LNTLKNLLIPHGVHAPPYRKIAIALENIFRIYEMMLHI